jgi:hypothetical protein
MTVNDRSAAAYQRAAHEVIAAANPIEPLRLTVISDSMWPLLRAGDAVRVQPIEPAAIRVGDVVVVRRGADLITHRVIDIDGEHWVTRGDNAVFADAPVPWAACLGRVSAIEHGADPIDLAQPQWSRLNRRLAQIGRVQWRINRWLRLTPASSPVAIRLAWLMALPFRALTHRLVMRMQAV